MFRRNKKNEDQIEDQSNNNNQNSENDLESCKKELGALKERLMRISADLQNYKRRIEKEKVQWMNIAQSELLIDLLPIFDDLDRALQEIKKEEEITEVKLFVEGFEMIRKLFYKFFDKYGIKEIVETKKFDPNLHEAISQVESPDHNAGEIVEILQKGFMLRDKVLRPAKVVAAK